VQDTSWDHGLELVADDERLVAHVGAVPVRLLCDRMGLTGGLSKAMRRRGFDPGYDRGEVLANLAVTLILGGEAISDFRALDHLADVLGKMPSVSTVWRTLAEAGELQIKRLQAAVTEFRRHWWGLLEQRPEGFPWLKVAGRTLTGVTVPGIDATVVFAGSDKHNAAPTYKGGTGFHPNLVTCDNVDDVLVIDPRPGNAGSNTAADNIAALERAVQRIPGRYRHNVLIRIDGAGATHDLMRYVTGAGGKRGRHWEISCGWPCSDTEVDAIDQVPANGWQSAIDQDGDVIDDTFITDITGLLNLGGWPDGVRIIARDEPPHPRYRKRATDREKQRGRRYQLVATTTAGGQPPFLDARNLLARFRLLALPGSQLRQASPELLRFRLLHLPGRLTRGQRKRWLHLRKDWPWADDLIAAWHAIRALPAPT
jgi:Transposase DDE domain group 1